jgi:hypothetical protein
VTRAEGGGSITANRLGTGLYEVLRLLPPGTQRLALVRDPDILIEAFFVDGGRSYSSSQLVP